MRADARHRERGSVPAAQHLFPDGRQLLLRRLLQGRRDRARLGAAHRVAGRRRVRPGPGPAVGDGVRDRPRRRRTVGEGGRRIARPHPAPGDGRQLLVDGRRRPVRTVFGDLLRPRAGVRHRGRAHRRRGPLSGDLEPGLHAGHAGRFRRVGKEGRFPHPGAAPTAEHRHRPRCRTSRFPAAGRRQRLRDRPSPSHHRPDGGAVRVDLRRRARRGRPDADHRRPQPVVDDADLRRGVPGQRGPRATCCAGCCVAPCAAPGCSA